LEVLETNMKVTYNMNKYRKQITGESAMVGFPGTPGEKLTPQYILSLFNVENEILREAFLNIVDSVNPSHRVLADNVDDVTITINTGLTTSVSVGDYIDVYTVLQKPALQHAVKKILMTGKRGHKDEKQDLVEIISALSRAV
jgi:hypothetical protein